MDEQENNAYEVELSGTFINGAKEIVDFQQVKGFIPLVDEKFAEAMLVRRYAKMFLVNDPKYPDRVERPRSVYVDKIKPCKHEFTYIGADIKEMSYEELQDLAVAKDLRAVPLYKTGGLREGRTKAYAAYSEAVLREKIGEKEKDFNFAKLAPMRVDGSILNNIVESRDVDEIIQSEIDGKKDTVVERVLMTRKEMEALAEARNVNYHPAIADDKLYDKLFAA